MRIVDWIRKMGSTTTNAPIPSGTDDDVTTYNTTSVTLEIDDDDLQRAISDLTKKMTQAGIPIGSFGETLSVEPPYERIEKINVTIERNPIFIGTYDDPDRVVFGPTDIYVSDQNGYPVPDDLERQVRELVFEDTNVDTYQINKLLEEWKTQERSIADKKRRELQGHKLDCPYNPDRPTDWGCTCQPPTIFGSVELFHCWSCELPQARTKDGVCENCEPSEYSSMKRSEA